ncbi:enoyl-CoA hydratase-related protein [Methylobacter sp. BlB1]|uniref:enoyl-CoA hydratase-related protein n=1 Tax=Methylobacter sp. BlB1 TaxID=2785914 RepID=UPI001E561534|nr:enoyl-CoA hydratase-related protein [Methylobacter sp. BlB1]
MDNHIAVIGAGRMRISIIDFLLSKGFKVTAITRMPGQAENLNGKWKKTVSRQLKYGAATEDQAADRENSYFASSKMESISHAGIIIETVNEDIEVKRIEESPVPVVAAINGACFGGGLELALACHIWVLGQSAMLPSSEYITADKAVEIGLAHYAIPRLEVLDKAFDVLHQMLGNKSVKAINYIMKSVLAGRRMDRKSALELEAELVVELVESQYNKRKIA